MLIYVDYFYSYKTILAPPVKILQNINCDVYGGNYLVLVAHESGYLHDPGPEVYLQFLVGEEEDVVVVPVVVPRQQVVEVVAEVDLPAKEQLEVVVEAAFFKVVAAHVLHVVVEGHADVLKKSKM